MTLETIDSATAAVAPRAPRHPWLRSAGGALAGAVLGAALWYLAESLLGRSEAWWSSFVGATALLVGVGAGLGAFLGSGRHRGWRTQAVAVAAALAALVLGEALVIRLVFVRELSAMGYHGATFQLPVATWWEYVSWGLFSSNPPGLVFWAITLGYAVALPRDVGESVADGEPVRHRHSRA